MTHPAPNIQDPQNHVDDAAAKDVKARDARFARMHAEAVRRSEERRSRGEPATVRASLEEIVARVGANDVIPIDRGSKRAFPEPPNARPVTLPIPDAQRRMVPERFWCPTAEPPIVATLDNYVPKTDSQAAALEATKAWLRRAASGQPAMLALIGKQGTGKSHLLYGAAIALMDAAVRVYTRAWYRLADELRYGGVHPVTGASLDVADVRRTLMSPPWGARVWLIDEVRATSGTSFDDTELTKLACMAYDARLPMMITTNTYPLADVMGAPAASRFQQVVIDGPDARQS